MKINGNSIKVGMVIQHQSSMWRVVKTQSVKPGKGGAYNQVELKNVKTGSKLNERFRSNQNVERLYIEGKIFQFLYSDKKNLTFMDKETYEQIEFNDDILGESKSFLQEGMEVTVAFIEDKAVSVELPEHVVETVIETEAVVKGQTVSSSFKPAILANGIKTMVPGHIEIDSKVVIATADSSYVERYKG